MSDGESKPDRCTCDGYPQVKQRSGSGHHIECPCHKEWLDSGGFGMNTGAKAEVVYATGGTAWALGDEIKAMGGGLVGGLAIPFSGPDGADIQGDFFTPRTDFGLDITNKVRTVFDHGLSAYKGKRFGVAELSIGEHGVFAKTQLDMDDPIARKVYRLAEDGKLFHSSGSVSRLVDRKSVGGKSEVTAWPLIEISLTEHPVDRRNRAAALKALLDTADREDAHTDTPDGPAVAATLVGRAEALVADAEVLVPLFAKAFDQRRSEGRDPSGPKLDALKALDDRLRSVGDSLAAAVKACRPRATPEQTAALQRRLLLDRIRNYRNGRDGNQAG